MISMDLPRKERLAILGEQVGVQPGSMELNKVLPGQPLVRRQQDDAVQFPPVAVQVEVVLVLKDVDVHEQRLAAAGRIPEGDLAQVGDFVGRNLVLLQLVDVELLRRRRSDRPAACPGHGRSGPGRLR